MRSKHFRQMWIYLMLFGAALSVPTDELNTVIDEGEFFDIDRAFLKQILPSGYTSYGDDNKASQLYYKLPKYNEYYTTFNKYVETGITIKGLTFDIYNDNMRNATIALVNLIRDTRKSNKVRFEILMKWIKYNVNDDMLDYAWRLAILFDTSYSDEKFLPPFLLKPNYFVGGETIFKALYINDKIHLVSESVIKIYQILNIDERSIAINTNYSGWNTPLDACAKQINYFIEDIGLNSYYYGLQLLHPFWMTNEELDILNPRHAESYYFTQKQLYARYLLEKDHLQPDVVTMEANCEPEYNPYLYYENGLAFPSRCGFLSDNVEEEYISLQTKDLKIKELIQRGAIEMESGTRVLTDMNLLAKHVHSQMNSVKNAKIIRCIFGYRASGCPVDTYNPAPSVFHHPQTTLREPIYWYLIKKYLDYFSLYINTTKPYNISQYENNAFTISDIKTTTISTNFQYYLINLYKSLEDDKPSSLPTPMPYIYARQRRLYHEPFTLKFTIDSQLRKNVTIRLFLGPSCSINDCWDLYFKFFQLDCYRHNLKSGRNILTWSTDSSSKYYSDESFNKSVPYEKNEENYDIYKFPKSLVIPKGRENGLDFTIFIMIDDEDDDNDFADSSLYMQVTGSVSSKPSGFPFHQQVDKKTLNNNAPNYRFYNISVFHKKSPPDNTGYFSPNVY